MSAPPKVSPHLLDDDGDGEEAPAPTTQKPAYVPSRKRVIVSHSSREIDSKQIVVVEKTSEAKERIRKAINTNFMLSLYDPAQKQLMIDAMFPLTKKNGDVIIKQGDKGDNFYVLDSGEVDVLIEKPGTGSSSSSAAAAAGHKPEMMKVNHLVSGQSFGEIALIQNCPRTATIVATTDCNLWAIDEMTFKKVNKQAIIKTRSRYNAFIRQVKFFDKLSPEQINKVCDAVSEVEFIENVNVVTEGEIGRTFYIIEEGECDIFYTDEVTKKRQTKTIGKNGYFGEIALINADSKRQATVRTKSHSKMLVLKKEDFLRLLGPIAESLMKNSKATK